MKHPDDVIFSWLANNIDSTKLALDIGSKYGAWTKKLQQHIPNLQVVQFEPRTQDPSVQKLALSDQTGTLDFYVDLDKKGWSSLVRQQATTNYQVIQVKVDCLDNLNYNNVGFIKIDVEGNELHTLRGAEKTIVRDRPVIYFECADSHLITQDYTCTDLYTWFNDIGYTVYDLDDVVCPLERFREWSAIETGPWYHNFIAKHD